ncbi:unnamed protein product [Clonostachys chloroleuca]|uniref:Uncharacterized protein n=1 Tax=Clonostachys chloroleuca TaxID=1926264 RepID=A0AA35LXC2_9HYPO|nr:unnamed protein product [Clonostachys chloroleuca]
MATKAVGDIWEKEEGQWAVRAGLHCTDHPARCIRQAVCWEPLFTGETANQGLPWSQLHTKRAKPGLDVIEKLMEKVGPLPSCPAPPRCRWSHSRCQDMMDARTLIPAPV